MGFKKVDVCIIGSGIVGLAVGLRISKQFPNIKLLILDKEDAVARHQTGHNSGVIHAGIYYSPGSQKANFCSEGSRLLRKFADDNGLLVKDYKISNLKQNARKALSSDTSFLDDVADKDKFKLEEHIDWD